MNDYKLAKVLVHVCLYFSISYHKFLKIRIYFNFIIDSFIFLSSSLESLCNFFWFAK